MDTKKRKKLEAAGFKVGTAQEFLGLSDEEVAVIDMKLALARKLRDYRQRAGLSQQAVARRIGSSQPRVARMEAGDPQVSMDLLVKSLLAVGASPRTVGSVIGGKSSARSAAGRTGGRRAG